MKIAFDQSPLFNENKNRGVGKYTYFLKLFLEKTTDLTLISFKNDEKIPSCDLVHYPYYDPFFLTLPLIKRYPTVVTIHDLVPLIFPEEFPRGLKGELKWQIQKQSLKSVKAIITDSENSKKDIIKFTGINSDKIHVVYLAPLLTNIKITEQEIKDFKVKRHLPDKFLLYVGDINFNKNLPNLFKALQINNCHCEERGDEAICLVLVGQSFLNNKLPEKTQLDNLAGNLLINDRLIKLGGLTDKEIKILYQLASIYIQPSFYEGFGLPVMEAMSSGCPVVCSDRGSLPEIGGNAVLYINPDNLQSIADGIVKILHLDDRSRQYIIEKGKIQASKFTWDNTIQQTIEIYKNIIK